MASMQPGGRWQAFTDDGLLAAGYKLYTRVSDTNDPQAVYLDKAQTIAATNPVVLNARGEAIVYWGEGKNYRIRLERPDGTLVYEQDNFPGDTDSFAVQSLKDFGVKGDGSDETSLIQTAVNLCAGQILRFNPGIYKITDEIVISSALYIQGSKGRVQINQATQNKNHFRIGDGTTPTRNATFDTTIDGITFAPQNGVAAFTSGACIRATYAARLTVVNCDMYGADSIGRKLFHGFEFDRLEDSRINFCEARKLKGSAARMYGAAGVANRTVDVRFESPRFYDCDSHIFDIDGHATGLFFNNAILLGVAANKSAFYIDADPVSEQGTNYFILNPNIEVGNQSGASAINVVRGQAVDVNGGWIGGVLAAEKAIWLQSGASSCSIRNMRIDGGSVYLDAAASSITSCELSALNGEDTAILVSNTASNFKLSGLRIRSYDVSGIAISGTPQHGTIDDITFTGVPTGSLITGQVYTGGPSIGLINANIGTGVTAAATITLPFGKDVYQVTGATVITDIVPKVRNRRVTIQASTGGNSYNNTGTLIFKTGTTLTVPQFKTVSFVCDGSNWFEDGGSY